MSLRDALESLPEEYWSYGRVQIRLLMTEDDLIYAGFDCRLSDEQKELVNPAWFSIGRAYLNRENNYPCIIYNESMERIGFISLCKWLGSGDAYSWSFFVDMNHQGKGYGKDAANAAIRILRAADPDKTIKLAAEEYNHKAHDLYYRLGFSLLSEKDGDDLVFGL